MDENLKRQMESLNKRIEDAESNVNAAKNIINKIYEDYLRVDYTQIEGEMGKFDGFDMVTEDGKKFNVNENYAAKSKLVYGDVLKLIEEDGKNIYKQIEKVDRERVEGIMTKKEGEWYLLTDRGSYKVSDAAAEFHKAELNSQAVAYLPADNLDAPFATLDTVERPHVVKSKKESVKKEGVKKKPAKTKVKQKEENIKDMNKKEMDLKKKTKKAPAKGTTKKSKPKSTKTTSKTKKTTTKSKKRTSSRKTTIKPSPKSKTKSSSTKKDKTSASSKILADDDLV